MLIKQLSRQMRGGNISTTELVTQYRKPSSGPSIYGLVDLHRDVTECWEARN